MLASVTGRGGVEATSGSEYLLQKYLLQKYLLQQHLLLLSCCAASQPCECVVDSDREMDGG